MTNVFLITNKTGNIKTMYELACETIFILKEYVNKYYGDNYYPSELRRDYIISSEPEHLNENTEFEIGPYQTKMWKIEGTDVTCFSRIFLDYFQTMMKKDTNKKYVSIETNSFIVKLLDNN